MTLRSTWCPAPNQASAASYAAGPANSSAVTPLSGAGSGTCSRAGYSRAAAACALRM